LAFAVEFDSGDAHALVEHGQTHHEVVVLGPDSFHAAGLLHEEHGELQRAAVAGVHGDPHVGGVVLVQPVPLLVVVLDAARVRVDQQVCQLPWVARSLVPHDLLADFEHGFVDVFLLLALEMRINFVVDVGHNRVQLLGATDCTLVGHTVIVQVGLLFRMSSLIHQFEKCVI